jgi:hypothetical protein
MLKETLLCIGLCCVFLSLFTNVHAEKFKEKVCVGIITKGEMFTCYFGNPQHNNTVHNYIELKNNPELVDQFIQFLEYGMVLDD